nr:MAG TPA: hypothetical protein [Caudoviricetes sp.]
MSMFMEKQRYDSYEVDLNLMNLSILLLSQVWL